MKGEASRIDKLYGLDLYNDKPGMTFARHFTFTTEKHKAGHDDAT